METRQEEVLEAEKAGMPQEEIRMPSGTQVSSGQQAMWFLYKMTPLSSAYNFKHAAIIKSEINADLLKRALQTVMQRYPVLRTTYSDLNGRIMKTVLSADSANCFYFEEKNAQSFSKEEVEQYLIEKCEEPFDLAQGPIVKAYLVRVSGDTAIFLLLIHHIASDFVTLEIIEKELGEVYTGLKNGNGIHLSQPAFDYTDFAIQEAEFLNSDAAKSQREYWLSNLAGELPVLNLPADKPRTQAASQKGGIIRFTVDKNLTKKVKELAANCGATPYRLFMAAYYLLLYRYTGQKDLIVGSPVSLRRNNDFNDTAGYFVNMLPFRINLEHNLSFNELLAKVNSVILAGLKQGKYPFSRMVAELQSDRDLTRPPIFQVSFTMERPNDASLAGMTRFYLGGPDTEIRFGELAMESFEFAHCASQYELSLFMEEIDEEYCAWFLYQTDLFYPSTVEQMAGHFVNILAEVTENPLQGIDQYRMISAEEKERVLNVWNRRDVTFPSTVCIHKMIEQQVRKNPGAVAVSFGDAALSYGELNQKANQLAHYLRMRGVGPGVMVPICMNPGLEMIVGLLGILKSGGAYVPLNPVYPTERIRGILEEVQPIIILSGLNFSDLFACYAERVLLLDAQWDLVSKEDTGNLDDTATPGSTAYIIYTSGSTGKPKGVMVSHSNVVRLFAATGHWYQFNNEDVWTLFHSFAFDFSVWEIFGALVYGGRLVVVPYFTTRSPEDFYKLLSREKVTVLNQTPSAFRQLIRVDEKLCKTDRLSLRYVIFGGEALELKTLAPWYERHGDKRPQLINMYGITETTVHVTYRPLSIEDVESGSGSMIGMPIPDLQVYILDENKNIVPNGCSGEIYVGGAGVAQGYFKREDLTRERFVDDFINPDRDGKLYRSGDLARFLHNGDIEYLGRIDHQVKIRGFRIELGDIEAKILEFPGVREVVVAVREDAGDKRLAAYVVMKEEQVLVSAELRTFLKARIPEYMVPAAFVEMDFIPMTANGKVNRKALPVPPAAVIDKAAGWNSPKTELEKAIAGIWRDVLGVESVGTETNFFDIGGNSLLIVQIHSRLQQTIPHRLEIITLFQYPTIKSLANFILSQQNSIARSDGEPDRAQLRRQARMRRKIV
ncbi:non-ribosomal peptide synthetase [Lucifera butyrica]|nr:non-ribosomal peptide synthetase [Lucifera butyrica]